MGTRIIQCQVESEYIKGAGVVAGAARSHDDVYVRLVFNEMWEGLTKKITWLDSRGDNPTLTILTPAMLEAGTTNVYLVPIPYPPKAYEGNMVMTIKGVTIDTHTISSSVVAQTWNSSPLGSEDGTYIFIHSGSSWQYLDTDVLLSTYGITCSGNPIAGDKIKITAVTSQGVRSVTSETIINHPETRATISARSEFVILPSDWDDLAEEADEITASQAAQLQSQIDDITEDIVDARAAAEEAAESADEAEASASEAEISSTSANASKESAAASAITAGAEATSARANRMAIENMTVGATTLPAGTSASATKGYDAAGNIHIQYGIPSGVKGDKGDTGAAGPTGATGPQGMRGAQGPAGQDGINGVAVATSGTYAFNVTSAGVLQITYTGDEDPGFYIGQDGHLYIDI